ncbi:MAG: hypothetical protein JXR94_17125, partial [Candidatus Hydrogenedentes bacterium]|nr:hypothetical protein [Candidatus Hydrogenedentota bacterium]
MSGVGLVVAFLAAVSAQPGEAPPPCTNGSFEALTPGGFPVDWGPVGKIVEPTPDAHSGERAIRMLRELGTDALETGINRAHTVLIERLKGGIDFWYKGVSVQSGWLRIYVIPMNAKSVESDIGDRAAFDVPENHIGDGQWHHARLKYDYSDCPDVKRVHFAARVVAKAG